MRLLMSPMAATGSAATSANTAAAEIPARTTRTVRGCAIRFFIGPLLGGHLRARNTGGDECLSVPPSPTGAPSPEVVCAATVAPAPEPGPHRLGAWTPISLR